MFFFLFKLAAPDDWVEEEFHAEPRVDPSTEQAVEDAPVSHEFVKRLPGPMVDANHRRKNAAIDCERVREEGAAAMVAEREPQNTERIERDHVKPTEVAFRSSNTPIIRHLHPSLRFLNKITVWASVSGPSLMAEIEQSLASGVRSRSLKQLEEQRKALLTSTPKPVSHVDSESLGH